MRKREKRKVPINKRHKFAFRLNVWSPTGTVMIEGPSTEAGLATARPDGSPQAYTIVPPLVLAWLLKPLLSAAEQRGAEAAPESKLKAVEALAVFANEGAKLVEKQLEVYDSIAAAVMAHDDDDVEPDQVWERVSAALRREPQPSPPAATRSEATVEIRPVMRWFAEQMELALRANDHKGGWQDDDPLKLAERIVGEYAELEIALGGPLRREGWLRVIAEAADIANMAMMVADHFREGGPSRDQGHDLALPAPPKEPPAGQWVSVAEAELESGAAYWVLWEGVVQDVPWVWNEGDETSGWLIPGDDEQLGELRVDLCMRVALPPPPSQEQPK